MKLTIEINMDSAAFEPINGREVARILSVLVEEMKDGNYIPCPRWEKSLQDLNGNTCGKVVIRK